MSLGFVFQSPGPTLFEWGSVVIRWYGFLIASAVLIGVTLSQYLAKRRQIDPNLLGDLAIWLVIGAIPCARIYYVLFEWQQYSQHPNDIFAIWKGGIAIHGAILGGAIAAIIFARLNQTSLWLLLDLVVPSVALGQTIGRWGNFFNSEAFGRPTDLPWKLYIPPYHRPPEYLNYEYFHPTFLYESLWNAIVFCLLIYIFFWGLRHQEKFKSGSMTFIYLIAYGCGRFWIESLRTDSLMLGSLRIAQVVSLITIAIGLLGLVWLYLFKRPLPDVVSKERLENKVGSRK
jgi:phosphatidylglycerol---prolipoprotein diacylglyceryl transferase